MMKKWVLKRATTLGAWVSMYEQREMNARQVMKVVEGGGVGCFIGEEEWRIRKCIGRIWLAKIGENVGVSNGM
ncbi:hypothetical protein DEO72_LG10g1316 [Vigna unguiculata]|uniref:Uncharacterized protein n=1 Tax=Vigna unguiculata TaxID=3917 RepID=A0A4D6N8D5_VIGUN|nr:hypothetical protein DEO72_LG10g1316 [Vigna unguiculata]